MSIIYDEKDCKMERIPKKIYSRTRTLGLTSPNLKV